MLTAMSPQVDASPAQVPDSVGMAMPGDIQQDRAGVANITADLAIAQPEAFGSEFMEQEELYAPAEGLLLAQVVAEEDFGTAVDTVGTSGNEQFNISGGQSAETNVFHSFEQFDLEQGQSANFQVDSNVENVLGRVVGGEASIIDGAISVEGGNPNLFLMNPAGMIFGKNASLDLPASFTATTADGMQFGENDWFDAERDVKDFSTFLGEPTEFRFSTGQSELLLNEGNLKLAQGEKLTLIGGTVVNTGSLAVPQGHLSVVSTPGKSKVKISHPENVLSLEIELEDSDFQGNTEPTSLPELLTGKYRNKLSNIEIWQEDQLDIQDKKILIPSDYSGGILSSKLDFSDEREIQLVSSNGDIHIQGISRTLQESDIDTALSIRLLIDSQKNDINLYKYSTIEKSNEIFFSGKNISLMNDFGFVPGIEQESRNNGLKITATGSIDIQGDIETTRGSITLTSENDLTTKKLANIGVDSTLGGDPQDYDFIGLFSHSGGIQVETISIDSGRLEIKADKYFRAIGSSTVTGGLSNSLTDEVLEQLAIEYEENGLSRKDAENADAYLLDSAVASIFTVGYDPSESIKIEVGDGAIEIVEGMIYGDSKQAFRIGPVFSKNPTYKLNGNNLGNEPGYPAEFVASPPAPLIFASEDFPAQASGMVAGILASSSNETVYRSIRSISPEISFEPVIEPDDPGDSGVSDGGDTPGGGITSGGGNPGKEQRTELAIQSQVKQTTISEVQQENNSNNCSAIKTTNNQEDSNASKSSEACVKLREKDDSALTILLRLPDN